MRGRDDESPKKGKRGKGGSLRLQFRFASPEYVKETESKAPQAVVKIPDGGHLSGASVKRALTYVARFGAHENDPNKEQCHILERVNGTDISTVQDVDKIYKEWVKWHPKPKENGFKNRQAMHMIFSADADNTPENLKRLHAAVRSTMDTHFRAKGYEYIIGAHLDGGKPHVHVIVRCEHRNRQLIKDGMLARSEGAPKLRIGPSELFSLRHDFARELKKLGLDHAATLRRDRPAMLEKINNGLEPLQANMNYAKRMRRSASATYNAFTQSEDNQQQINRVRKSIEASGLPSSERARLQKFLKTLEQQNRKPSSSFDKDFQASVRKLSADIERFGVKYDEALELKKTDKKAYHKAYDGAERLKHRIDRDIAIMRQTVADSDQPLAEKHRQLDSIATHESNLYRSLKRNYDVSAYTEQRLRNLADLDGSLFDLEQRARAVVIKQRAGAEIPKNELKDFKELRKYLEREIEQHYRYSQQDKVKDEQRQEFSRILESYEQRLNTALTGSETPPALRLRQTQQGIDALELTLWDDSASYEEHQERREAFMSQYKNTMEGLSELGKDVKTSLLPNPERKPIYAEIADQRKQLSDVYTSGLMQSYQKDLQDLSAQLRTAARSGMDHADLQEVAQRRWKMENGLNWVEKRAGDSEEIKNTIATIRNEAERRISAALKPQMDKANAAVAALEKHQQEAAQRMKTATPEERAEIRSEGFSLQRSAQEEVWKAKGQALVSGAKPEREAADALTARMNDSRTRAADTDRRAMHSQRDALLSCYFDPARSLPDHQESRKHMDGLYWDYIKEGNQASKTANYARDPEQQQAVTEERRKAEQWYLTQRTESFAKDINSLPTDRLDDLRGLGQQKYAIETGLEQSRKMVAASALSDEQKAEANKGISEQRKALEDRIARDLNQRLDRIEAKAKELEIRQAEFAERRKAGTLSNVERVNGEKSIAQGYRDMVKETALVQRANAALFQGSGNVRGREIGNRAQNVQQSLSRTQEKGRSITR